MKAQTSSQCPRYVPTEAWEAYRALAPERSRITINGKPFAQARASQKQDIYKYYELFSKLVFFSPNAPKLWKYWEQHYSVHGGGKFLDILWGSYASQTDIRKGIARAKKSKQKDRIEAQAKKLARLIDGTLYIKGLGMHVHVTKLLGKLEALSDFLEDAEYGVDGLSNLNAFAAAHNEILSFQKNHPCIDFQRMLAIQLELDLQLKSSAKLKKLILLATECFFEENTGVTLDEIGKTLRRSKARSHKK